jgi:hypothetical protein
MGNGVYLAHKYPQWAMGYIWQWGISGNWQWGMHPQWAMGYIPSMGNGVYTLNGQWGIACKYPMGIVGICTCSRVHFIGKSCLYGQTTNMKWWRSSEQLRLCVEHTWIPLVCSDHVTELYGYTIIATYHLHCFLSQASVICCTLFIGDSWVPPAVIYFLHHYVPERSNS